MTCGGWASSYRASLSSQLPFFGYKEKYPRRRTSLPAPAGSADADHGSGRLVRWLGR